MSTGIEWTDETWNPIGRVGGGHGCSKVSPGCDHCYAEVLSKKFWNTGPYDGSKKEFELRWKTSQQPYHWKKPRRIFVCSMTDLFHHDIPDRHIIDVLSVMRRTERHTYQILTKRPERASALMFKFLHPNQPNVWLGISAENQKWFDKRTPVLLEIPAAIRFVSVEPMLGPVTFRWPKWFKWPERPEPVGEYDGFNKLAWVILGCESGHLRRECKLEWMVDAVRQCKEAGVAVFVKQVSIDGRVSHDMNQWPEELRIREFPKQDKMAVITQ